MEVQLTCSLLRSAAMSAFGFDAKDELELLKLVVETVVCNDALLAFLVTVGWRVCGGGSDSWRLEDNAAFERGILCERVPTRMATG